MAQNRNILLIDMNSFFASVEQQCNPELRGKPIVVGGPAGSRSVVSTASYEARKYGIHSAMPVSEALSRCPHLIIVRGDMRKYSAVSRKVFTICGDYTDLMEICSIDECFLDVTNSHHLFGGPRHIAEEIKRRIREDLGLTCSIGIGPNKILAKLAANMQKPDGLVEIKQEEVRSILENLPVGELHGIGEKSVERLRKMGITKAGALGRAPADWLTQVFGSYGEVLQQMGNGTYETPVVPHFASPDVKSVGHSHTLEKNTLDWDVLSQNLLRLSEMVGRRLREKGFAGRTVTLVVRYGDMQTFTRRRTLSEHIDGGYDIYEVALSILNEQVNGRPIRLIGVSVSNLSKDSRQLNLFEDDKSRKLTDAVDAINDKYGEFKVRRASLIRPKP